MADGVAGPAADDDPSAGVLARDYAPGTVIEPHSHSKAQLLFAIGGAMWVTTADRTVVVPGNRAVWVPARMQHRLRMAGPVAMRALFFEAASFEAAGAGPADQARVVAVTPLLRALILRLHDRPTETSEAAALIRRLILLELRTVEAMPLHLPQPRDPRLRALCARLLADPGCPDGLETLAAEAGASARTMARLFRRETGLRFTDWRHQVRLAAALTLLADGKSSKAVARRLGFRSASAFSAAFRRSLGRPPTGFPGTR